MQKILRRVATAERVAAKRGRNIKRRNDERSRDEMRKSFVQQRSAMKEDISLAKQAYKDDWTMGPLAPRLYIAGTSDNYGAISESRFMTANTEFMSDSQLKARCKWAGHPKRLNIAKGDRVVLLEGPDKGRIGKITNLEHEKGMVTVEGLNKTNVRAPFYMREPGQPAAYTLELPLPISSVRLVYPVQDPSTGITKDVIVNQLISTEYVRDRVTGKERWSRMVPGLNMTIPWPVKPPKEIVEHPIDTLRIAVEERTFVPTLLRPPMPEAVLDELRNKYSRFRTRHEPEYIAAKESEVADAKDRSAKLMETIRTPLQELHRQERAEKKKKGKPRLTIGMLEEIGKVIAKNRENALSAAAMSSATPVGSSEAPSGTASPEAVASQQSTENPMTQSPAEL